MYTKGFIKKGGKLNYDNLITKDLERVVARFL